MELDWKHVCLERHLGIWMKSQQQLWVNLQTYTLRPRLRSRGAGTLPRAQSRRVSRTFACKAKGHGAWGGCVHTWSISEERYWLIIISEWPMHEKFPFKERVPESFAACHPESLCGSWVTAAPEDWPSDRLSQQALSPWPAKQQAKHLPVSLVPCPLNPAVI